MQEPTPSAPCQSCLHCTKRSAGWFCNLSPESLEAYDALGSTAELPGGAVLFSEGHRPSKVAIVCRGRVKLTVTSPEGRTLLVKIAKAGDLLGLNAALRNLPYEVTAQALEPTSVRRFPAHDFLRFLQEHPEGGLHAAESMSREYMAVFNDAYRLALSPTIISRVVHLLLEIANEAGGDSGMLPEIDMPLRHEDLACMLGSSRESVTRAFGELKRIGLIEVHGSRILLVDKDELSHY